MLNFKRAFANKIQKTFAYQYLEAKFVYEKRIRNFMVVFHSEGVEGGEKLNKI